MTCPACGTPVIVEGNTTKYYVPNGTLVPTDKLKEMQERIEHLESLVTMWHEIATKNGQAGIKYLDQQLRLAAAEEALRYYASTYTWMPTTHEGTHDGTGLEDFQQIKIGPGEVRQIAGKKARAYFEKYGDKS